jgi:hypothetical protein
MRNTVFVNTALALGASLLAACGDMNPSSTIPTDQFYARFVAETREDGMSRLTATFLQDEDWFYYEGVYLDGGDTLTFRTREDSVVLPGGANFYVAELLSGITENTRFEFDLQRPVHADAPNSYGTLPAPMDVLIPEPGQDYSVENDQLTVAWSDPGTLDDMWLRVEADCRQPDGADYWYLDEDFTVDIPGDPGAWAVNLSDHFFHASECKRYQATVTLYRARAGTLDPAYAPIEDQCEKDDSCRYLGYVSVRQVRSVPIVLTP